LGLSVSGRRTHLNTPSFGNGSTPLAGVTLRPRVPSGRQVLARHVCHSHPTVHTSENFQIRALDGTVVAEIQNMPIV